MLADTSAHLSWIILVEKSVTSGTCPEFLVHFFLRSEDMQFRERVRDKKEYLVRKCANVFDWYEQLLAKSGSDTAESEIRQVCCIGNKHDLTRQKI